jgi:hypothetical protein
VKGTTSGDDYHQNITEPSSGTDMGNSTLGVGLYWQNVAVQSSHIHRGFAQNTLCVGTIASPARQLCYCFRQRRSSWFFVRDGLPRTELSLSGS